MFFLWCLLAHLGKAGRDLFFVVFVFCVLFSFAFVILGRLRGWGCWEVGAARGSGKLGGWGCWGCWGSWGLAGMCFPILFVVFSSLVLGCPSLPASPAPASQTSWHPSFPKSREAGGNLLFMVFQFVCVFVVFCVFLVLGCQPPTLPILPPSPASHLGNLAGIVFRFCFC